MDLSKLSLGYLLFLCLFIYEVSSAALKLTTQNFDEEIKKHKVVLVNFYADWCRFSQMLQPTFDQAADIIKEEFPDAALGKVDSEVESDVAQRNVITKYPTLKVFRNGHVMRKEYRGQRSVDAFTNFVRNQMKSAVREYHSKDDFNPDFKKNTVIAFLDSRGSENFKTFEKVADELREDCDFIVGFGDAFAKERSNGDNIVFRAQHTQGEADEPFSAGQLTDEAQLKAWATNRCIPMVREITFENGEELTEEGLPFLLLFHLPSDIESLKRYKAAVERELVHERGNINFLSADGTKFSHPLHHLERSEKDLPLIAIDSFRHMYLFPKFEDIDVPGKLRQFVADLHSGKLHREFHNGPDPSEPQIEHIQENKGEEKTEETKTDSDKTDEEKPDDEAVHPDTDEDQHPPDDKQDMMEEGDIDRAMQPLSPEEQLPRERGSGSGRGPKETVFDKLKPSENRYTLLRYRDEL